MTGRLADRAAVVTGGGRGIGRAIVEAFVAEGARVTTCGRGDRPDDLSDAVAWMTADVSAPSAVAELRRVAQTEMGPTRILVNNAGVQIEKTVVESTDEDWDLIAGANMRGVFNCCREFIPGMEAAGGGVIVNIGSIAGDVVDRSLALYNGTKAFVHGLTRAVAADHGPAVRCNAISPGWIMTDMADDAFGLASDVDAARAYAERLHPVGRFGRPEDIARAAVFLASDDAAFVTGECLTVDGGLTGQSPVQPTLY